MRIIPRKKENGNNKVIKSGNLRRTTLNIIFGSIKPSDACSKYPTNLDPTTKRKKINNIPVVVLKTSTFKLFERIFFLFMPCEVSCITIFILSVNTITGELKWHIKF